MEYIMLGIMSIFVLLLLIKTFKNSKEEKIKKNQVSHKINNMK